MLSLEDEGLRVRVPGANAMKCYFVFGGCLSSELSLPDLPTLEHQHADWNLFVAPGPPTPAVELLGEHAVGAWSYHLFRTESGFRLCFAEHYVFDLGRQGTQILWYPHRSASDENMRSLLLGPVLALAQYMSGALCLHGSAVAIGQEGVALLASKHQGKSTLGLALALGGGRLLSDDTVVVDLSPPIQLRPGVHSIRLWDDSLSRFTAAELECLRIDGLKGTLTDLPERLLQVSSVPLAAIYMLRSISPASSAAAVERIMLAPAAAALGITGHTKLPQPLVGRSASGVQFQRAVEVARSVPVYELRVVRDFDRLTEVVDTILAWH
jgi:hypothetical protein